MAKRKQEVWTKRCPDASHGRDERTEAFRPFMPDDYDICDWCLMNKYGLVAQHDACDQMGMGPEHIEKEAALKALRAARKERADGTE